MPVNRIARHLDAPPAPPIPPKEDLRGRYQFMSDAVLKAVAAVTRLLESDDPNVVMKAAKMILDLEKTRMRHGQQVHGLYKPDYLDVLQVLGPVPGDVPRDQPPSQAELADEFERIKNEVNRDDFDEEGKDFDEAEELDDIDDFTPRPQSSPDEPPVGWSFGWCPPEVPPPPLTGEGERAHEENPPATARGCGGTPAARPEVSHFSVSRRPAGC